MESLTIHDFERGMDVVFWGVVYTTLAVLPEMRRRRQGRIVNITSMGGKVAVRHLLPYDCAKFAAIVFSEGLTAEAARDGVKVVTIAPDLMLTPGLTVSGERTARRILEAVERGEPERIPTASGECRGEASWAISGFHCRGPGSGEPAGAAA